MADAMDRIRAAEENSISAPIRATTVSQIRSESERQGYTDKMSQELIAIIGAAIVLAGIIVTGQWGMRRDIAALGERTQKDTSPPWVRARGKILPPWASTWVRWS